MSSHAGAGNDRKRIEILGASIPTRSRENQTALSKQTQMNTSLKEKTTEAQIVEEQLTQAKAILEEQRKQYIHLQEKAQTNKNALMKNKRKCIS